MTAIYQLEACPSCHADWRGSPIIPDLREHFGGASHTSRVLHFDNEAGEVIAYGCPDCGHEWAVEQALEMRGKRRAA